MNKLYDLIIFHNGTTPALNEDNLNAMSQALDAIDDRVVSLGGAVLEVIPDLEDILSNAEQLEQYRNDAVAAASDAEDDKEDAEAYAVGTRNGVPVTSGDPAYHNNAKYYSEQTDPTAFANMSDVNFDNLQNGQVPVWNASSQKWENGSGGGGGATIDDNTISTLSCWSSSKTNTEITNRHKVTTLTVDTSNWTTDTTSQSGTTLYKKQISLNHMYANPIVDIGSASGYVLPTTAEQEAYDLLEYVTADDTVPCLYLYASEIPTDGFYINAEGCD